MNLDSSQLEFVNSEAANIRLLAPAGSGKTTTLLYRCKRLLERTPGERVLFIFAMVSSSGWTPVRERLSSDSYSVWATEAM